MVGGELQTHRPRRVLLMRVPHGFWFVSVLSLALASCGGSAATPSPSPSPSSTKSNWQVILTVDSQRACFLLSKIGDAGGWEEICV